MKVLKTIGLITVLGLLASCGHMTKCHSCNGGQCSTKKESACDKGQCPMSQASDKTAPTEAPKAP